MTLINIPSASSPVQKKYQINIYLIVKLLRGRP
jgi:hypothetical protein